VGLHLCVEIFLCLSAALPLCSKFFSASLELFSEELDMQNEYTTKE
jgi:hypothetical protein